MLGSYSSEEPHKKQLFTASVAGVDSTDEKASGDLFGTEKPTPPLRIHVAQLKHQKKLNKTANKQGGASRASHSEPLAKIKRKCPNVDLSAVTFARCIPRPWDCSLFIRWVDRCFFFVKKIVFCVRYTINDVELLNCGA